MTAPRRPAHAHAAWAVLLAGLAASLACAQSPVLPAFHTSTGAEKNTIQQAGCSTCNNGLLGGPPVVGHSGPGQDCGGPCGPEQCSAGRFGCDCGHGNGCAHGGLGGTFMGLYQCICCNDPCYEPRWIAMANNAFFVDSPRPVTQMKLGVDFGWDLTNPDKSELFFARANQKGPRFQGNLPAGAAAPGPRSTDFARAYMYNEAAVNGVFSFFIETPIVSVEPDNGYLSASGFGDMVIGTKSVILDCELLLSTFQFKTFLPTGNATKGLGTGHVSLEPSLIAALKLSPHSYLQGQIGYRFPIGGTGGFAGSLVYGGLAYNHLLWNCGHDIELVGTIEANLACATNGGFTDPDTGVLLSSSDLGLFFNAGPGLRLVLCKKVDFGVGTTFALTDETYLGHQVRMEFRWRF